jgi:hypothetical protein
MSGFRHNARYPRTLWSYYARSEIKRTFKQQFGILLAKINAALLARSERVFRMRRYAIHLEGGEVDEIRCI